MGQMGEMPQVDMAALGKELAGEAGPEVGAMVGFSAMLMIQHLVTEHGMSNEEAAERMGVPLPDLYRISETLKAADAPDSGS